MFYLLIDTVRQWFGMSKRDSSRTPLNSPEWSGWDPQSKQPPTL